MVTTRAFFRMAVTWLASVQPAFGQGVVREIDFETFIAAVANQHPERAIDEESLAQAREAESRAGVLADPQFSVGREDVPLMTKSREMDEEVAMREPLWRLSLSQSFPWPGTLSAEERAAKARTANVDAETKLAAARRRFEAAELFLQIVRTSKLIDIARSNLDVAESIRSFSHEKFKQGIGSHVDFLQTHSESAAARTNVTALAADLRNLKRHALLLMSEPSSTDPDSVTFSGDWPKPLMDSVPDAERAQDVVRESIAQRRTSELAASDAEYRRTLPSLSASGMIMQEESGDKMYGAMLGISLPLFSHTTRRSLGSEKAIVEARAEHELSWHDARKAIALEHARSQLKQVEETLRILEEEILPPLRDHIKAATAQFSQGKGDLGSIVEGRRTLLGFEVTEVRLLEATALAKLQLEKVSLGLVDDAATLAVPQLSTAMTSGGMTPMPDMRAPMPQKTRPVPQRKSKPQMGTPVEEPASSGNSGMGM